VKKVLASMIVVGSMSFLTLSGTFATLSGEVGNHGTSIASGTLTFSDTANTGTACYSYGGVTSNLNSACDALMTASTLQYPGTPATAKIVIANNGSLDASKLYVYMPSCTQAATPGAPTPVPAADPCAINGVQFTIQETDSSWAPTACRYPSGPTTCVWTNSTLYAFSNAYPNSGATLNLGSGPAHNANRYFIVGLELPANASNALQGQEALFDLTWGMTS
jgi:hypothetical protein